MYEIMKKSLAELIGDEKNFIANASNFSAFLYDFLDEINWAGFYFLTGGILKLGPFQGKPACINIEMGKGVCGTAAEKRETLVVDDVHSFPGHIACDAASRSEIVIPVIHGDVLYGVLDIDSPIKGRFSQEDARGLASLLQIVVNKSDIEALKKYYG